MYRFRNDQLEVFLVHPGGPFWQKKDLGAWSIPKGEHSEAEDALAAAKREFFEETGFEAEGKVMELSTLRQSSGKRITAWALEGNCDAKAVRSNTFNIEWPPHSGQLAVFPEVDGAEWFSVEAAKSKILKAQRGFIDELCSKLCWDAAAQERDPQQQGAYEGENE